MRRSEAKNTEPASGAHRFAARDSKSSTRRVFIAGSSEVPLEFFNKIGRLATVNPYRIFYLLTAYGRAVSVETHGYHWPRCAERW